MSWASLRSPAALLVFVLITRAPASLYAPVDVDETDWVTIAQMVRSGASLYADVAEKKPPLSYWFYIPFARFGFVLWPVQLAAIAWCFATALVVRAAAARVFDREAVGWAAAWIAAFVQSANVLSVNAELMLNLPAALALWAFAEAERSRRWSLDLAAGVAIGLASLFKHQGGILLVALGAAVLLSGAGTTAWSRLAARASALAAGFTLPWVITTLVYLAAGHGDAYWEWNVARNFLYATSGGSAGSALGRATEGILLFVVLGAPVPWLLAIRATARAKVEGWGSGARLGLLLALWLTWIPVALGGRFYAHYFLQLAPPLALVAAPGAVALAERLPSLDPWRRRAVVFGWVLPLVLFQAIGLGRWLAGDFPGQEPRAREVSRWLAANTAPRERVFVWGHFTPIYYFAGRLPGTRYTNTSVHMGDFDPGHLPVGFPLDQHRSARDLELTLLDLEAHQTEWIVDTAPADIHHWSRCRSRSSVSSTRTSLPTTSRRRPWRAPGS